MMIFWSKIFVSEKMFQLTSNNCNFDKPSEITQNGSGNQIEYREEYKGTIKIRKINKDRLGTP